MMVAGTVTTDYVSHEETVLSKLSDQAFNYNISKIILKLQFIKIPIFIWAQLIYKIYK